MSFQALPNYILRTPIIAFNSRSNILKLDGFDRQSIKSLFYDVVLSETLYIASPELYEETTKCVLDQSTNKKDEAKLIDSLIKYLSRIETRATPFGLFAGCEVGILSEKSEIRLSPIERFKRHTRLDMNFLCALSSDIMHIPEVRKKLKYFPNSSLYSIGNSYRYVEYIFEKTKRIHHIISIQKNSYIDSILEQCRKGSGYFELINIVEGSKISFEEASIYINELIDNQVIVSELEPSTTGPEQLDHIFNIIKEIEGARKITVQLENIISLINNIDTKGIGNPIKEYEEMINIIKETGSSFDKKFLFQTDLLVKSDKNTISKKIPEEIKKVVSFLQKINFKQYPGNLEMFKDAFYERYEDREIPIAEALDTELGIGYAGNDAMSGDVNRLIDDLRFPDKTEIMEYNIKWDPIQSFLLKKYRQTIQKDLFEINVTDEEIDKLVKNNSPTRKLAKTFSVMTQIIEFDAKSDTYKILVKNIGGATGAYLLGRFCHGDPEIHKVVEQIAEIEQKTSGDAIVAEIVHLPESRTGNVLLRPVLRNYEIPYLARSSVTGDCQLRLDDLFISLKRNQIVLRSKKLDKVIFPRLTNAHNFSSNALPIYNFLCDLQFQGIVGGLAFSWGNLTNEFPFLPRVMYNNIILSPAQWNLKISEIKKIFNENDNIQLLENIKSWRIENKIPHHVLLSEGDNDLFIDLEVEVFIKMFWNTIKNREVVRLKEFLFNPEKPLVTGPDGCHTNEIIFIFKSENND